MAVTTRVAILGSTGSIGRQTLAVIDQFPDLFTVVGLAAGNNVDLLTKQARRYRPRLVSSGSNDSFPHLDFAEHIPGQEGLAAVATMSDADIVVAATSGHSAIEPTLAAIRAGKRIALANKEAIVCAGALITAEAQARGVEIHPVDSEHSAIWQCLMARRDEDPVERVTLTASGGALRNIAADQLAHVTVDQALAHPNWRMGPKVTIDSATLMNKGLEVIEAHWLFGLDYNQIDVVIHPQSIVHSLVTFVDGSIIAQLGVPDMRLPIQYALTYPHRMPAPDRHLDLVEVGLLEFSSPDHRRFPGLQLARDAGVAGDTYPTVLSGADEVAVDAFLEGRIGFLDIIRVVEQVLDQHSPESGPLTLERISTAYHWTRSRAAEIVARGTLDR
jgi:1-deoxy-D-xylulose-5-phosphate reductoisomerase